MTSPPLPPVLDPPARLSADTLIGNRHRILVTGGAVFSVGAVMRRSLRESVGLVFNRNKCGNASDVTSIEKALQELGQHGESRHRLLGVDLADAHATTAAVQQANPHLVLHLAAESQDDRSNKCRSASIKNNITGTFNLLLAERVRWEGLPAKRRELIRIHNISTDEVLCPLVATGRFTETTSNTHTTGAACIRPARCGATTWFRTGTTPTGFRW